MSTTVRGMVIILVVGVIVLMAAALMDRRTRLRMERERPTSAGGDDLATPAYVTAEQLAAGRVPATPKDDAAARRLVDEGERFGLRLAASDLASLPGGRSLLESPAVLACAEAVTSPRELMGVLQRSAASSSPLVVAAPELARDVVELLAANDRAGTLRVQGLVGLRGEVARLAELAGTGLVPRTDLQADDVTPERLGHARAVLADAHHTWVQAA